MSQKGLMIFSQAGLGSLIRNCRLFLGRISTAEKENRNFFEKVVDVGYDSFYILQNVKAIFPNRRVDFKGPLFFFGPVCPMKL